MCLYVLFLCEALTIDRLSDIVCITGLHPSNFILVLQPRLLHTRLSTATYDVSGDNLRIKQVVVYLFTFMSVSGFWYKFSSSCRHLNFIREKFDISYRCCAYPFSQAPSSTTSSPCLVEIIAMLQMIFLKALPRNVMVVAFKYLSCWVSNWLYVSSNMINNSFRPNFAAVNSIIIGSDNGLSPGRRQTIIWTNTAVLLIGHLGRNVCETGSNLMHCHSRKYIWKCRLENRVFMLLMFPR